MGRSKKQQNKKYIPPHKQKKIVENYDIISMEDLNIKGMFQNKKMVT